ncbi:MAG: HU family DNA-binding protein [Erysipelotrichaceae bacterium]|jgi:DNA-binding protein HU-beta|nr:HU family DNA-binding protein [Erysipelotrichaceae bacterium]
MILNKKELSTKLAEEYGLTGKEATAYVQFVFDTVAETLKDSGTVDIYGFGKFSIAERAARTGINPQTKEKIEIAASKSVKFKASKALKDSIQ